MKGKKSAPSRRLVSAAALALLACPRAARASFQDTPLSVKAEAMGGAFVAAADDATAVMINPAGLPNLDRPEADMMYGKLLAGLDGVNVSQGYLALGLPVTRSVAAGVDA